MEVPSSCRSEMSPAKQTVQLPSLFVHFLAQEPKANPLLDTVHPSSVQAVSEFCQFDTRTTKTILKGNASYLFAVIAPEASLERYRTMCDWGNWIFTFDDQFDNGHLRDQPQQAASVIRCLMSAMTNNPWHGEKSALVQWHDKIWDKVVRDSSPGTAARFAQSMAEYSQGALHQVRNHAQNNRLNLDDMVAARRRASGASILLAFVEYANNLHIPDEVFEHPVIKELEILAIDFNVIVGDILSYRKEEMEGVPHNVVASCRAAGLSAQDAFDHVGKMLDSRYERLEEALGFAQSWQGFADQDIQKYIDGIANIIAANLYWSFKSGRYFGSQGETVKRTGIIDVMVNPPYLEKSELRVHTPVTLSTAARTTQAVVVE